MKKHVLAIAVATGLMLPAASQAEDANVSLFGVAHVSLNDFEVGSVDGDPDLTSNKSHIGFKGSKELDGGLTAFVMASWQVDYTDNTNYAQISNLTGAELRANKPNTDLLVYDRYVGLKGNFGNIKFGTMASNYKQTGKIVDPFWATRVQMRDTGLMSPALMNGIGVDRSRITDAIQYTSKKFNNVFVVANVTVDGSDDNNMGFSIRYMTKNLKLFLDYLAIDEVQQTPPPTIVEGEAATKVGGAYTIGGTTIALAVEMTEDLLNNDYNQFSVEHKLNKKGSIAVSYGMAEAKAANSDRAGWVLGYKHKLGKKTQTYIAYTDQSNDNENTEISGYSLGLKYKF